MSGVPNTLDFWDEVFRRIWSYGFGEKLPWKQRKMFRWINFKNIFWMTPFCSWLKSLVKKGVRPSEMKRLEACPQCVACLSCVSAELPWARWVPPIGDGTLGHGSGFCTWWCQFNSIHRVIIVEQENGMSGLLAEFENGRTWYYFCKSLCTWPVTVPLWCHFDCLSKM